MYVPMHRCTLVLEVVGHLDLDKVPPICLDDRTRELSIDQEPVSLNPVRGELTASDSEIIETSDACMRNEDIRIGGVGSSNLLILLATCHEVRSRMAVLTSRSSHGCIDGTVGCL